MTDPLELLKELPRHQPDEALRRDVRIAALGRLQAQPRWRLWLQQIAVPLTLAAFSALYLVRAAADTPLLR